MTPPVERMKAMRARRQASGLGELRFIVPDSRARSVQQRITLQVASLRRSDEEAAMDWIEAVSEFDGPDTSGRHETR